MTGLAKAGNFGAGTTGMTLQQAVFAGLVDPGNIVAVREILTSTTPDTDVALFSGPRTNYTIDVRGRRRGAGHHGDRHVGTDGIDTVRNVETLRFTDQDVAHIHHHRTRTGGLDLADHHWSPSGCRTPTRRRPRTSW